MDHHLLKSSLTSCSLHDPLVKGVGRDQAVYHDWLGLSNAVAAILSLQVRLGVLGGTKIFL